MSEHPHAATIARFNTEIEASNRIVAETRRVRAELENRLYQTGYEWARDTATLEQLYEAMALESPANVRELLDLAPASAIDAMRAVPGGDSFSPGFCWEHFRRGVLALFNEVRDQLRQ